jgi:hypothetical protein
MHSRVTDESHRLAVNPAADPDEEDVEKICLMRRWTTGIEG